jgi:hypothetical protein
MNNDIIISACIDKILFDLRGGKIINQNGLKSIADEYNLKGNDVSELELKLTRLGITIMNEERRKSFENYITETFAPDDIDLVVNKLQTGIKAPWVRVNKSTLGGPTRASAMITVSLDPKNDWINDILQNSRYFNMSYNIDGTLELFSGGHKMPKFRKTKAKNVEDAIGKINKFIALV